MRVIHKYQLTIDNTQKLILHQGFRLLSIKNQNSTPCLWVEEDTNASRVEIIIKSVGTGHEINFDTTQFRYIDTVLLMMGSLVLHYYVELK